MEIILLCYLLLANQHPLFDSSFTFVYTLHSDVHKSIWTDYQAVSDRSLELARFSSTDI